MLSWFTPLSPETGLSRAPVRHVCKTVSYGLYRLAIIPVYLERVASAPLLNRYRPRLSCSPPRSARRSPCLSSFLCSCSLLFHSLSRSLSHCLCAFRFSLSQRVRSFFHWPYGTCRPCSYLVR